MSKGNQPRAATRPRPLLRLEHLWVVLVLSLVGSFISLVPTSPNDFWWHLKVGQLITTEGIPTTNMFAWTLPAETPFVYQSWLGEWLLAVLVWLGGLPLTVFARNMLGLAAFALVALEAQRRSGSWRLAAGAVLLAAGMAINNLSTRTQMWSWVPFALLLWLLGSYAAGRLHPRWLAVLPLLMLFWVNVHGGFIMGLLVVGAFVAGETLRRLVRQPDALSQERLWALYAAAAAMAVAILVNPRGFGIIGYVQTILTDAPIQQLIVEWQPPDPESLAGTFFFFSILLLLAAFALARRRPTITDVLLVCGLGWLAFNGVRSVIWFGMAAMPVLVQCMAAPPKPARAGAAPAGQKVSLAASVPNLLVAVLLAAAVVLLQPWIKPLLPLPQPYQALFAPVPGAPQLFEADTPVLATEHLRGEPCAGNLFNELGYGSYLIWALSPQEQVFIDPRIELFPGPLWNDYALLSKGRDVETLLGRYDVACVLLDRTHQPHLAETMAALDGWQRSYHDERSEVWRRDPR